MSYIIQIIVGGLFAWALLAPLGQSVKGAFEQVNNKLTIIQEVRK